MCGLRAPSERDHYTEHPAPHVAAVCDRGVQHRRNEDASAIAADDTRTVLVVCDGVTNAVDSDVASLAAARAARDVLVAAAQPGSDTDEQWRAQLVSAAAAAQGVTR